MPKFKNSDEYEKWKAEKLKGESPPEKPKKPKKKAVPDRDTEKIIKICIAAAVLIVSISIGYYFLIYMPIKTAQKEKALEEQQTLLQQKVESRERDKEKEDRIKKLNEEERRKHLEREAEWIKEEALRSQLETEKKKQEALKAQIETEKRQEAMEQQNKIKDQLNDCIDNAWATYHERWNTSCRKDGQSDDCSLPAEVSETYSRDRQRDLDNCYETFDRLSK